MWFTAPVFLCLTSFASLCLLVCFVRREREGKKASTATLAVDIGRRGIVENLRQINGFFERERG